MRKRLIRLAAGFVVIAAIAVVGAALASAGGGNTRQQAKATAGARHAAHAQLLGTSSRALRARTAVSGENDPYNTQQGDQGAPDTQSEQPEQSSPEAGSAGDSAQGHADSGDNAQHDCTGNCQE